MSNKTVKSKKPKERPLTLKQQGFIDAYTDIENGITYGNKTQSYMKVYNTDSYHAAGVEGHRLLNNPRVVSEIDRVIEELGMGSKVRLQKLNEVLTGVHQQKTTTTSIDKDGNKYTSTTLKAPTARDRLAAIDLLGKIDGTYDKNRVKADVMSTELKNLIKVHRKDLE